MQPPCFLFLEIFPTHHELYQEVITQVIFLLWLHGFQHNVYINQYVNIFEYLLSTLITVSLSSFPLPYIRATNSRVLLPLIDSIHMVICLKVYCNVWTGMPQTVQTVQIGTSNNMTLLPITPQIVYFGKKCHTNENIHK